MLALRLTSLAFCYRDGFYENNEINATLTKR